MPKVGPKVRVARRNQFMGAARDLAAESGFRALIIDDVCTRAGMSKGAFYLYFTSKQELLHAMLEEEIAQVDKLLDLLNVAELPELEKVRVFVRTMVQRAQDPAEVALRAELWSQVGVDEQLRARIAETVRMRRARLAAFATAGAGCGELVEVPPNAFGAVLVALVDGLLVHHAVDPTGFQWQNIARVVDILLDHLGVPAGASALP